MYPKPASDVCSSCVARQVGTNTVRKTTRTPQRLMQNRVSQVQIESVLLNRWILESLRVFSLIRSQRRITRRGVSCGRNSKLSTSDSLASIIWKFDVRVSMKGYLGLLGRFSVQRTGWILDPRAKLSCTCMSTYSVRGTGFHAWRRGAGQVQNIGSSLNQAEWNNRRNSDPYWARLTKEETNLVHSFPEHNWSTLQMPVGLLVWVDQISLGV